MSPALAAAGRIQAGCVIACLLVGCSSPDRQIVPPDAAIDAPTRCTLPAGDPSLFVANPDCDGNPRPFGPQECPTGWVLTGLVVVDLGTPGPDLIDGFIAVCAPRGNLAMRTRGANSDVNPPQSGATELVLDCPSGQVA